MEALLNGLLQYSRIGRGDETLERVDTGALVREIVALYADTHTLTIEIDPDLPRMYLAKTPFSIVVRNLIGNAIKHHSRPDGHIWVHASDRDDQVAFTIRDDGPGILPQYHEEIFKMFSTLHTPNETSGSGLGLAMVKKALEFVGGDIKLDSNEGQGVSITFTWPKSTQVQT
jgi:signal transduction histidine kinase